jgi:hypothetical protein
MVYAATGPASFPENFSGTTSRRPGSYFGNCRDGVPQVIPGASRLLRRIVAIGHPLEHWLAAARFLDEMIFDRQQR